MGLQQALTQYRPVSFHLILFSLPQDQQLALGLFKAEAGSNFVVTNGRVSALRVAAYFKWLMFPHQGDCSVSNRWCGLVSICLYDLIVPSEPMSSHVE